MSTHDHAAFAPSSMGIIVQCPGSWTMQQLFPKLSGVEAAEGDAAHWVLKEAVHGRWAEVNSRAPNGIPVTQEMLDGAELWCDHVGNLQHHEQRVEASEGLHPDCWGTPDAWEFRPSYDGSRLVGGRIMLPDYKFGHRFVEVFNNWQLMTYAKLIVDELKLDGMQEQFTVIEFAIVQPRSYHVEGPVRRWCVKVSDLRAQFNIIRAAIVAAQQPGAPCKTGPECRDCTARAYCETLQRSSLAGLEEVGRMLPLDMPPAALGLELRLISRAIDRLKARMSGLEQVALAKITTGTAVPGFRTETGKGRRRWNVKVSDLTTMEGMLGIKLTKVEPITPGQAVKAGLPEEMLGTFTTVPNGEIKLVEDDGTFTRKIFGGS